MSTGKIADTTRANEVSQTIITIYFAPALQDW